MNALSTDVFDDSKNAPELPQTQDTPPTEDSPPPLPQEGDLPPIENLTSDEATGVEQDGKAAIFADPQDLWRYRMARANGASHEEAESVGDSGVSRYGEVTATAQVPMVALPADTPGFQPGRLVKVSGDDGSVIAKLAEPMPRSDQLKGNSNIEVNPAAALAIGHQGGIQPVKWQFVSDPGDSQQVPVLDPKNIKPMSSRSTTNLAGSGISLSDILDSDVVSTNKDGSLNLSNGMILGRDRSITFDRVGSDGKGARFVRHADGSVEKLGEVTPPKGDAMDTSTMKELVQRGLEPVEGESKAKAWQRIGEYDKQSSGAEGGIFKNLSPSDQKLAQAISEYKYQAGTGSRMLSAKDPSGKRLIAAAFELNPDLDMTHYQAKQRVANDFTSGKDASNITSLNTAIGHLEELKKAADDLNNFNWQPANTLVNYVESKSGDPRFTRFNNAANAVAGEMSTVFKGTSGTDPEIKSWREQINSSQSPAQLHSSINELIDLMGGRMRAIQEKWERGMETGKKFPILDSSSERILKSVGAGDLATEIGVRGKDESAPAITPTPAPIQPQKVTPDAAAAAARRQLARNPNDEKANALLRALGQTP